MQENLNNILHAILDDNYRPVCLIDTDGSFHYANKAMCELLGITLESMNSCPLNVAHKKDVIKIHDLLEEKLKDSVSAVFETSLQKDNGNLVDVEINATYIQIEGGNYYFMLIRDTNLRKKVNRELKLYKHALDSAINPILITNSIGEGRSIVYCNDALVEQTGYEKQEIMGRNPQFLLGPEEERHLREIKHAVNKGLKAKMLAPNYRKDGSMYWNEIYIAPISASGDKITHWISIQNDVTGSRKINEELRENQDRLVKAQQLAGLGFWEWNIVEDIAYWSDNVYELFGVRKGEFNPGYDTFLERVHPDDVANVKNKLSKEIEKAKEIKKARNFEMDFRIVTPDGLIRYLEEKAEIELDELGNPRIMAGTILDITKQKISEKLIMNSRQQLKNLNARLYTAREEERHMISRELHDEFGQRLTGLKMDMSRTLAMNSKAEPGILDDLTLIIKSIDETTEKLRLFALNLRPAVLDDLGLVEALKWESNNYSKRAGFKICSKLDFDDSRLSDKTSIVLFRIYQEAMTNILRHAKATRVEIDLCKTVNNCIQLTVRDNGIGLDPDVVNSNTSIGLIGMRERAEELKGRVIIGRNEKMPGTHIVVTIPFEKTIND